MRKPLFQMIVFILLAACTTAQPEPTSTPLSSTEPPPPTDSSVPSTQAPNPYAEEALSAFAEASNNHEYERAKTFFSEDVTLRDPSKKYEGLDGLNVWLESAERNEEFVIFSEFEIIGDSVEFAMSLRFRDMDTADVIFETCSGYAKMEENKILFLAVAGCEEVARGGELLLLTFDGESCTYEGPTTLKAEPISLQFLNESEGTAVANLVRHTGDETIQDAIDNIGEEPSTKHHPSWTVEIFGVYQNVSPGESHIWEGVLEPGIYHMVCAKLVPLGVWFGTGLTVEE